MKTKRLRLLTILQTITVSGVLLLVGIPVAAASFNANDLIDDSTFDNITTKTAGQIDAFLNGFSGSCISMNNGFKSPQPTGYTPSGGFSYGGDVSAGTVIYDAAQVYGVNPEVILTTLQKEQSLVSGGSGCSTLRYVGAMGNDCPDGGTTHSYSGFELYSLHGSAVRGVSGTCVDSSESVGFSRQVTTATWKLAFFRQRAEGNVHWNVQHANFPNSGNTWDNSDDPGTCYNGYMTAGSRARSDTSNSTCSPVVTYGGVYTINSTRVTMGDGATAALYYYTPHLSGNQNFDTIYSGWFGSPTSPCMATGNLASPTLSGHKVVAYQYGSAQTNLAFFEMNNTGSACAELHALNPDYKTWMTHIATGMRASDPSAQVVLPMKFAGSKKSGLIDVAYNGAGGYVAVHKLSPDLSKMNSYEVATNLPTPDPTKGTFVTGDFLHRGYDQLAYILYSGSSGHVEIHLFNSTLKEAIGYYDVATNLPAISSASGGMFVAGDFLGRGYDQLAFILYNGSTGHDEVHLFDPTLRKGVGFYDQATDLSSINTASGTFVAGDFLGRGYDQLAFVRYAGSGGHVELHIFSRNLKQAIGVQDNITLLSAYDPNN
jgi:hypothetical protein